MGEGGVLVVVNEYTEKDSNFLANKPISLIDFLLHIFFFKIFIMGYDCEGEG